MEDEANLGNLSGLSLFLGRSISESKLEASRLKDHLNALINTKYLVDRSMDLLGSSDGMSYASAAESTVFPSGDIALGFCERLGASSQTPERLLISSEIQEAMQYGVSAWLDSVNDVDSLAANELKCKLNSMNEKIVGLEVRLAERLSGSPSHLEEILNGAIESYHDMGNPLRFTNAGNAFRELFREFMEDVAPDDLVKKAPWFVPDTTSKNGVTRRHRIGYAIYGNLSRNKFPLVFVEQVDELSDDLISDIGRLSSLTHVTEEVLDKSEPDVSIVFSSALQHFLLLISAIQTSRNLINESVSTEIQSRLWELFTNDYFDDLDCLSTHTRITEVSDVDVGELTFDEEWISFNGSGTVECSLQYGSNGDVDRGDGHECSEQYPFSFSGRVPIARLSDVEIYKSSINVDTSSFYE